MVEENKYFALRHAWNAKKDCTSFCSKARDMNRRSDEISLASGVIR
jgi:hypothetical protein